MDDRAAKYWEGSALGFNRLYARPSFADRWLRRGLYLREIEALALVKPGASVLDLGCGPGRQMIESLRRGAAVAVGVEAAAAMRALAERSAHLAGCDDRLEIHAGDYRSWSDARRFDLVLALGVFDYETDPDALVQTAVRHCGGLFAASFRRFWTVRQPLRRLWYELHGCPIRFHTRRGIARLFERNGLAVESIIRIDALHFAVGRPCRA